MGDQQRRIGRLWGWYKRRPSRRVRDAIVHHYYALLEAEAKRLHRKLPSSVALGDLISDGALGLLEAIESFTPGVSKFETFGRRRILGAMLDGLRSRDDVSRSTRTTARTINEAIDRLRQMNGAEPRPHDVAAELGMSLETYTRKTRETRHGTIRSLASATGTRPRVDDDRSLSDSLPDDRQVDPAVHLARQTMKDLITTGMTRADRLIVILYYYEELTMNQIGRTLDLSESRVSQMHKSLIARLRAQVCAEDLMA